jgi:hypothetical protein
MAEQDGAGMDLDGAQPQASVSEGNSGEDSAMTVETAAAESAVAGSDGAGENAGSEQAPAQDSSDPASESRPAALDDESGNF